VVAVTPLVVNCTIINAELTETTAITVCSPGPAVFDTTAHLPILPVYATPAHLSALCIYTGFILQCIFMIPNHQSMH